MHFFYKLNLSLHESSPKQQFPLPLGVLPFQSTKSIDSLTKIEQKW